MPRTLRSFPRPRRRLRALLAGAALLLPGLAPAAPARTTWSVCLDQTDWPPQIEFVDGKAQGRHITLMRDAAEEIGVSLDFRAMPWVRCLLQAELGEVDAIASLVHSAPRAAVFEFPPGAGEGPNPFAVDEIDDVVITLAEARFEYRGHLDALPRPVRVPRGWEIGRHLREQGLDIDDGAPSDRANLIKLLRDRRGSVIATRESAEREIAASPTLSVLHISREPVRRLSYYLAFSRRTAVPAEQRQALWEAIARSRQPAGESLGPASDGEAKDPAPTG